MTASFEELVLKCVDGNSRTHINEAIRCYESGAYRAAIVSAYIAVCFDLIEKIRILDAAGDGAARILITRLTHLQQQRDNGDQSAIRGLLDFERNLLEDFRDSFDFLGANEFDELARLRDDRNRCAHPTFFKSNLPYAPSAELARLHIRNALTYVLTQEPRQGRAALAALEGVVLSQYFPSDLPGAELRLRGAGLSNARDALTRGFVDALIFGLPDKSSPYNGKPTALVALEAAIEINRPVALPRAIADVEKLLLRTEQKAIMMGGSIALKIEEIGEGINDVSKNVVRTWLSKDDSEYLAVLVRQALRSKWVEDEARKAVPRLTGKQIEQLNGQAPPEIIDRAADLYASASNWYEANDLAVSCALPFADRFTEGQLNRIFQNAKTGKADLLGSHGFKDFVAALYEKNSLGKQKLNKLLEKADLEYYKT